jgi:hypothetical protein
MSHMEKVPLKAFWEAVEGRLATCSADELRAILRAMAGETPPSGRWAFLEKLGPVEETTITAQQAVHEEDLLADIEDVGQELAAEMEGADEWEERYGWDEGYDEEDSLGHYAEFVEPLVALFDRTQAAFDYGNLTLARAAYERLFDLLGQDDGYGRGVGPFDLTGVDMEETCARYLRAVYETGPPHERPQALFEQMRHMRPQPVPRRLMLEDVIQISPQALPDREQFLADWIAFLRTQSGSDADAWLREAVRLSQGTPGMEALARAEGTTRPRAYLDWFTALEQEGKYSEVLLAAQEALQTLPAQLPIRAAIADHLCIAAAELDDTEALRAGRWQAFLVMPTLTRLLDLWDAAPTGAERTGLMRQAVQHVQDYLAHPPARTEVWGDVDSLERPVWIDKSVLAHACLLAEDFEAARQVAEGEQVLGWSSSRNPQGLLVPFFLVLLSGKVPGALSPNLAQLWGWGLSNSVGFWMGRSPGKESETERLERIYTEKFGQVSLSPDRQEQDLSWCLDVAQQRVNAIVGGKHRRSYDKAAVLTAACAEVLRLRGNREAATAFISEVRNRFPRHRAFQDELKTAVQDMERGLK